VKVPEWCRHPVIYLTVFVFTLPLFCVLYLIDWLLAKVSDAGGDDA
jgi:hypothetical protein